jgi:hypothetical protein
MADTPPVRTKLLKIVLPILGSLAVLAISAVVFVLKSRSRKRKAQNATPAQKLETGNGPAEVSGIPWMGAEAGGEPVAEIGRRSWTRHEADDTQRVEMSGQPAVTEAGGVQIVELTGDGPVALPGASAHTKYTGNTVQ